MAKTNYQILIEMRNTIIEYLTEEAEINTKALDAYKEMPIQDADPELRRMREIEAIKLRDRVSQAHRHIAVIKRMFPKE
jgi:hypothetical protein